MTVVLESVEDRMTVQNDFMINIHERYVAYWDTNMQLMDLQSDT